MSFIQQHLNAIRQYFEDTAKGKKSSPFLGRGLSQVTNHIHIKKPSKSTVKRASGPSTKRVKKSSVKGEKKGRPSKKFVAIKRQSNKPRSRKDIKEIVTSGKRHKRARVFHERDQLSKWK